MKSVVFLSKHKYPFGDASSKRNLCLGRYFYEKGYDVFFVGMGNTKYKKIHKIGPYQMVSLRKYSSKKLVFRIINHICIRKRITSYVKKTFKDTSLFIVDPIFYKIIRKDVFFEGSKIIYSAVEYYSPCNYKYNGLFSKSFYDNLYFNENLKKEEGSVIAISSYLQNCFISRNINAIRIPFVIDSKIGLSNFDSNQTFRNNKTFLYCGNPRRKDLLETMIRGFMQLPEKEFYQCKVIICGVDYEWLHKRFKKREINKINKVFVFKGYLPFEEVVEIYKDVTFSILLRPYNERYSKAGFPTKITEALEYGIIPITNFTSDLAMYLDDGENCIRVNGEDSNAFKCAISKSLNIDDKTITKLRRNARELCITKLDIKEFYDELDNIIH